MSVLAAERACLDRAGLLFGSGRLGPVSKLRHHRNMADYPGFFSVTAEVMSRNSLGSLIAAGGGLTASRALSAACGEAMERLCLQTPAVSTDPVTANTLSGEVIDPRRLLYFTPEQYAQTNFPLKPYKSSVPIHWVSGHSLVDERPVWVPAFAVYGATAVSDPFGPHDHIVSTGCACALTKDAAILNGLYEVIERDSFMIHWENRWPGSDRPLPDYCLSLSDRLAKCGFQLEVRCLDNDLAIPVAVAAVADQENGRASMAFGAAARANWNQAAERACEEAVLTSFWVTGQLSRAHADFSDVYREMDGLADPARHAFLYGFDEMKETARCLFEPIDEIPELDSGPANPDAEMTWLLGKLVGAGMEPFFVDITLDSIAALGFTVQKVLVPGLTPLARGRHARPLANGRLANVPRRLGRVACRDFNPEPHPFP
ncbi:YcaO-like family protein [Rhizobium jaguaris]|nr:YcaO-like family protein [Rhizobium jaguaris]